MLTVSERGAPQRWVCCTARVPRFAVTARVVALASLVTASSADAQVARRRFDPEDLKLEGAGVVHADLQFGFIRGARAGRVAAPDFGLDVGLSDHVELGVDGFFAREGTTSSTWSLDHTTADNVWTSAKLALFEINRPGSRLTWTGGAQLGPKIAAAPGAHGTGFESLLLFGATWKTLQLIANLGGFLDPGADVSRHRPTGVEGGFDFSTGVESAARLRIVADLSFVLFPSGQHPQVQTTFGPQVSVTSWLDVSPQALIGFFPDSDRWGALLVISPRLSFAPTPKSPGR